MKQIEVDYEVGQKIKIKANGIIGTINGVWKDLSRISYDVEWVSSTTAIMNRWFLKEELEEVN